MSLKTDVRLTPSQRLSRGLKYSAVGPVDVTLGTVGLSWQGARSAAGSVHRRIDKSRLAKEFGDAQDAITQEFAAAQLERNIREDPSHPVLVRQFHRHVTARENEIRRCSRRISGARCIHGAVTTILALSIGTVNCPRSFNTSIQTPSSSGLMVNR